VFKLQELLLRLEKIDKSFSGVKVLDNVTIELRKGSVLGLVGENGAGKSTLMNILGGVLKPDGGSISLDGKLFNPSNPMEASASGIAFIHQELNLFSNLSVAENIFIENFTRSKMGVLSYKKMCYEASKILEKLGEKVGVKAMVGELPMGTRQMVEIGKALTKKAKAIIFDEPTTSLSNIEKEKLFSLINEMRQNQVSIIYISHMLDDVFYLCDEIAVLRDGKLIGQQPKSELDKNTVIKMMVGRELNKLFPYVEKNPGKEIMKVENLFQGNTLKGVSLSLCEGEIVGMFGLMGAGRSEFVKAIYGVDRYDSGEVYFDDKKIPTPKPGQWVKNGVALITENRREEGLLMPKSIKTNLVLASLKQIKGFLNSVDVKKENSSSDWAIEQLRIRTYDKNRQEAVMLSGGNQQKVVIGKWLLTKPRVFLLDEPTRGIDVGAKYEIYNYINELTTNGSAILFISSEMDELMGVCDRIVVMCRGKITGEVRRSEYTQEGLLKLALEVGTKNV